MEYFRSGLKSVLGAPSNGEHPTGADTVSIIMLFSKAVYPVGFKHVNNPLKRFPKYFNNELFERRFFKRCVPNLFSVINKYVNNFTRN